MSALSRISAIVVSIGMRNVSLHFRAESPVERLCIFVCVRNDFLEFVHCYLGLVILISSMFIDGFFYFSHLFLTL